MFLKPQNNDAVKAGRIGGSAPTKITTMETSHQIFYRNSQSLAPLTDQSVDLVVTSPPYPMIEMWDAVFGQLDPLIAQALKRGESSKAFELMHAQLDPVWREVDRVLKPGGIVCINIGDATRTINDQFQLFANHARIIRSLLALGFTQLPAILWRKPTNSPNKFMGSGMLPPNAYVTLEHEYILIFRKNGTRKFLTEEHKELRRASAYFWEERNNWFSDVWFGLIGTTQKMTDSSGRARSGAYPFELAHRLILMFSVKNDTVLDPFLGTGTSLRAAVCAGRNSVGFEIDHSFKSIIEASLEILPRQSTALASERLAAHNRFVKERIEAGKEIKHHNLFFDSPVVTNQEKKMRLEVVERLVAAGKDRFMAHLVPWRIQPTAVKPLATPSEPNTRIVKPGNQQLELF